MSVLCTLILCLPMAGFAFHAGTGPDRYLVRSADNPEGLQLRMGQVHCAGSPLDAKQSQVTRYVVTVSEPVAMNLDEVVLSTTWWRLGGPSCQPVGANRLAGPKPNMIPMSTSETGTGKHSSVFHIMSLAL